MLSPLSTDDFPYTMGYVTKLLSVNENELMDAVRALDIKPRRDEQTGEVIFNHRETELIRNATGLLQRDQAIPKQSIQVPKEPLMSKDLPTQLKSKLASMPNKPIAKTNGDSLAVVVEAVSTAKEGILKDMSRLLDDKLAGLDDVVVELIRCKSENDTLQKKLKKETEEKEAMAYELARFKPAAFGFFRKD